MSAFELAATLVVLAALCRYVNHTVLHLPPAVGVMALALGGSVLIGIAGYVVTGLGYQARAAVGAVDLPQAFLSGMLGFILFAGALRTDLVALAARKWSVAALAVLGTLVSAAVVGLLTWWLLGLLGVGVRPVYCFLFGALISPTDPVAVLAVLRRAGIPKDAEVTIVGESLFNDGVAIVLFLVLLGYAASPGTFGAGWVLEFFAREALGGALFGLAAGWVVYRMLRSVDDYQVEILLTLALVAGGYALANRLGLSGPVAMATAGLLIGNHARAHAMSRETLRNLDTFWELIDETLNAVLFVLLGLEVLVLAFTEEYLAAGLLAVPAVLFARAVAVGVPLLVLRRSFPSSCTVRLLTWGGLRGGIAVALALAVPGEVNGEPVPERELILGLTYPVVVFSILVQGLTIAPLARRWVGGGEPVPELVPAD